MRNLAALARAVHDGAGRNTRAELTRGLGLARGTAAVLAAELAARELVSEHTRQSGRRGRPTGIIGPHPRGPVAIAVDLRDESWTIAAGELGGGLAVLDERAHQARPADRVLTALAGMIAARTEAAGIARRVIGVAVALPATISRGRIVQAVHLGWPQLDLAGALRATLGVGFESGSATPGIGATSRNAGGEIAAGGGQLPAGGRYIAGNDATLAGLAEARRGRLREVGAGLHLHASLGIGGVLIMGGQPVTGALGTAGEFGHMPLASGDLACPCGSRGCWELEVGANALLRHANIQVAPGARIGAAEQVIRRALDGDPVCTRAAGSCAAALGRGAAALVNAHDPQIVTLSGLAIALMNAAPAVLRDAYLTGLMRFRRADPPPLGTSELAVPGSLIGAAELLFDEFLTTDGLAWWEHRSRSQPSPPA
jgi:predicted NBD/HSP70 family sugar kinase